MKIQDIVFFVFFIIPFFRKDSRLAVVFGVISLLISIPLFATWVFFTAERLVWYAAAFFILALWLYSLRITKKNKK